VRELIAFAENESLEKIFFENETRDVVFGSYADGAPSPDGILFLFHRKIWDIIKE
jgi:hypothetical protein